ncbi:MAG: hypothetical protein P1V97_33225, partial [Planctomycetota bacterium]|nr:hypothetical protein [Planctomycetota bacterium]
MHEHFAIDPSTMIELVEKLNQLDKFPIRFNELEEFMGRSLKKYFNREPHDPGFVHDVGGSGVNVGGTPIYHLHWDESLPLVFELRSKYNARYRDTPGSQPPPSVGYNPMIDLVSISGRYDVIDPPASPPDSERFDDLLYAYLPQHYMAKPLGSGYVSLHLHDVEKNRSATRWVYQISTERGLYVKDEDISEAESIYIEMIDAMEAGVFTAYYDEFQKKYADKADYGIYSIGLRSYNVMYFNSDEDGPYYLDSLAEEGVTEKLGLWTNCIMSDDAHVPFPNVYRRIGFDKSIIERDIPEVSPGKKEGGLLYYNSVNVQGSWRASGSGFYPDAGG